jgi:hypothetical protein
MSAPRPALSKYIVLDGASARADRIWLRVSDRLERGQRGRNVRILQVLASSAVLALAFCAGLLMQGRAPSGWARLETSNDSVSVELQDGSRVKLLPQTRVELRESSESRVTLELEQGHLDCTVTRNPRRAFAIAADDFEVAVIGTQFGVELSRERNRLEVDVETGSVEVRRRGRPEPEAALHAGQRWSTPLLAADAPTATAVSAPDVSSDAPPVAAPSSPAPEDAGTAPSPPEPASAGDRPHSRAAEPRPQDPSEPLLGARQLLDRANAARRAGDIVAAARAYEQLLASHPNDSRAGLAAFELGRLRMDRLGDVRGALAPLEQATKLVTDPGLREDALARLVRAFDRLGENQSCLEARERYLEAHPTGVYVSSIAEACNLNP